MSRILNIIRDHKKKSNQVKRLKRKLKNKAKNDISLATIENMLAETKRYKIDHRDYYWSDDSEGYARDSGRRESRIEVLEEIIRMAKK